jgi:hypothetical protein
MAEGKIPVRLDGVPLVDVANISFQGARNVNQRATTSGVKISYGQIKPQIQLTFVIASDKQRYLHAVGAFNKDPIPHNLGFDLGADSFNCVRGIAQTTTAQTDQDGTADLQVTVLFEDIEVSPS